MEESWLLLKIKKKKKLNIFFDLNILEKNSKGRIMKLICFSNFKIIHVKESWKQTEHNMPLKKLQNHLLLGHVIYSFI